MGKFLYADFLKYNILIMIAIVYVKLKRLYSLETEFCIFCVLHV